MSIVLLVFIFQTLPSFHRLALLKLRTIKPTKKCNRDQIASLYSYPPVKVIIDFLRPTQLEIDKDIKIGGFGTS